MPVNAIAQLPDAPDLAALDRTPLLARLAAQNTEAVAQTTSQERSLPKSVPSQTPAPSYPAPVPEQSPQPQVANPGPPSSPPVAYNPYDPNFVSIPRDIEGSVYIPVDNWVYPQMLRLYAMGFVDTAFLAMRPWTRRSVLHMLEASRQSIVESDSEEAQAILAALLTELDSELPNRNGRRETVYGLQSGYSRLMGVSGTTLRDSFHLGQTIASDYGRPYQSGFNNITGLSTVTESGRFSLYLRGEYQHAPAGTGYSQAVASLLSNGDEIPYLPPNVPQSTIPVGSLPAQDPFRLVEATLSYHLLGHEISGGKSDAWLGPAAGSAMAWSNNAENIYSFRINRVEPLRIPLVSRLLGPVRYDFFYGSLKGHSAPNSPYMHSEMFSFQPTSNLQFAFQRSIIFGGEGHAPVTLHVFLKGFFSISDTNVAEKYSRNDPGARFSDFSFSYRLPFVRRYLTFYTDSITHDDVTPISAPRRAAYRTGLDLSQIPGMRKLELRVEAVSTDPAALSSIAGGGNYWEVVQRQGYTNKGNILGDWIGRKAKGGQAWLTYHISPQQWIEVEYLNKKTAKTFIPGGTTQNQFKATVVKRFHRDIELNAWVQYEGWKAPIAEPGLQKDTVVAAQITWFPKLKTTTILSK
ncbi:MAG TPA: capsule assembly Wzi family protein [Granulicella sp.]|jgi:hypothetical protein|nr:capsule assembly Wzi family protein [Granulicella sp.]